MILGRGDLKIEMILGGKGPILGSQSQPALRDQPQTPPGGVTGNKDLIKDSQGLGVPIGSGPSFILDLDPDLVLFDLLNEQENGFQDVHRFEPADHAGQVIFLGHGFIGRGADHGGYMTGIDKALDIQIPRVQ